MFFSPGGMQWIPSPPAGALAPPQEFGPLGFVAPWRGSQVVPGRSSRRHWTFNIGHVLETIRLGN